MLQRRITRRQARRKILPIRRRNKARMRNRALKRPMVRTQRSMFGLVSHPRSIRSRVVRKNQNPAPANVAPATNRVVLSARRVARYAHDDRTPEIPFPQHRINRIFAISIRPMRFDNLLDRMDRWDRLVTLWPGTNGEHLNKDEWIRQNVVVNRNLKRGEIGCYDSHLRVWKHVVENNLPNALILEDDADLRYGQNTANRINYLFDELDRLRLEYDLIYVGHFDYYPPKQMFGPSIGTPGGTQGLVMYYVTLQGARKLVDGALPMQGAVDDYVFLKPGLRQFVFIPKLGGAVPIERSDTAHIA